MREVSMPLECGRPRPHPPDVLVRRCLTGAQWAVAACTRRGGHHCALPTDSERPAVREDERLRGAIAHRGDELGGFDLALGEEAESFVAGGVLDELRRADVAFRVDGGIDHDEAV